MLGGCRHPPADLLSTKLCIWAVRCKVVSPGSHCAVGRDLLFWQRLVCQELVVRGFCSWRRHRLGPVELEVSEKLLNLPGVCLVRNTFVRPVDYTIQDAA